MTSSYTSPLLGLPGAVAAEPPDSGVAAHYGEPLREQRRLLDDKTGFVDLSHREVIRVSGPDRLGWLHSLTTQALEGLQPGESSTALILSPHGHIEHALYLVDDGEATWAHVEPGTAADLVAFLDSMRFLLRVEVADVTDEYAIVWEPRAANEAKQTRAGTGAEQAGGSAGRPGAAARAEQTGGTTEAEQTDGQAANGRLDGTQLHAGSDTDRRILVRSGVDSLGGRELFLPRGELAAYAESAGPAAGLWAYEALRVAAHHPRLGFETDHKSIPNELGWLHTAVHLSKGCYRGQETVARVHNLGRPPRRLAFLHLDGSAERLPDRGTAVLDGDKQVGRVTSAVRHAELGPVALAVLRRNTPVDSTLTVDGIAAAQEVVVPPDIGLHVRPLR